MLATIASLVLGVTGAGLGYAGWHTATRSAAKQRDFSTLVANQLVRHTTAVIAEQSMRSQEAFAVLSDRLDAFEYLRARLDGLEFATTEQLITRAEVSAAFAELAAIEEQRQRQAAAVRATAASIPPIAPAPMVAANAAQGSAPVDPWSSSAALDAAPANPATLISDITAMNERLREKLRAAGVLG